MNVLSLFDGMSTGRLALDMADIKVDNYYASEVEPNAIKIAQKNYPDTIQLGSVTDIDEDTLKELGEIDLLIGGSPCQSLSRVNIENNAKGLDGKSKLFYEYVRIFKLVKPKYFLLENVESMKDSDKEIITEVMGVEAIMIDSADFSAQDRKRYYWTNIPVDMNYEKSNLVLKDIVQPADEVEDKFWYDKPFTYHGEDKKVIATLHISGHDILKRVNNINGKSATLTTCGGGNTQKKVFQDGRCRKLTPLEYERLQTVPDNFTAGVANSHRYNMLGNGWTASVISKIFEGLKHEKM